TLALRTPPSRRWTRGACHRAGDPRRGEPRRMSRRGRVICPMRAPGSRQIMPTKGDHDRLGDLVTSAHTPRPRLSRATALVIVALWALLVVGALAPSAGAAPVSTSTPVTASPAQVAAQLFVAGDVARLGRSPSGTESIVLEQVLQQ